MIKAADSGFGTSRLQLMHKAGTVVKKLHLHTPYKNGVPGKEWFRKCKARNPEVSLRKPEKSCTQRLKAMNPPTLVGDYFVDLNRLMKENKLGEKPQNIWNMDETGVT